MCVCAGQQGHMEPGQISGVYAELSGLPAPLSAHVTEEQLPELRVYTVAAGELVLTASQHTHAT